MSNVSLIDGHLDNAEHCVSCGEVIPEGRQYCGICEKKHKVKEQIDKLKPCPFCGERNKIHIRRQGNHAYRVICHSCGALGPYAKVEEWHSNKLIAQGQAKTLWNRKADNDR